jgi:hypothetical protein
MRLPPRTEFRVVHGRTIVNHLNAIRRPGLAEYREDRAVHDLSMPKPSTTAAVAGAIRHFQYLLSSMARART